MNDAGTVESTAKVVLEKMTSMMLRGELKPGRKLPGLSEMAERFQVDEMLLCDSLRLLALYGVVEPDVGGGCRIVKSVSDLMLNPLVLGLAIEKGAAGKDLFELRLVVELGAVQLAVEKATDDDLQDLADNLHKYEGRMHEGDLESLAGIDIMFHARILEMSRNKSFIRIGRAIMQLYSTPLTKAVKSMGPEQILSNHRNLYEAIKAKDGEKARSLLIAAFEKTKEYF